MTDITDEDRRAAASILWVQTVIDDQAGIERAFAAHRLAAEARGAERERAWVEELARHHAIDLEQCSIFGGGVVSKEELRAAMIRELIGNIAVAPVVLLVRIPLGLTYAAIMWVSGVIEVLADYVPGFRIDCYRHWRKRP